MSNYPQDLPSSKGLIATAFLILATAPMVQGQSLEWMRQFGTEDHTDQAFGVSADGLGNVYVTGSTSSNLGGTQYGGFDAFVAKYDAAGALQWTRQLGTTADDKGSGVSVDHLGNVYISGSTGGNLGGTHFGFDDAFIAKYDATGALQWTRQLGTVPNNDSGGGVSADGLGNVYMSGNSGANAYISKFDADGVLQWMSQSGTIGSAISTGVSTDHLGNAYISGWTNGNLGGTNAGGYDAFISKYDSTGSLQWTRQVATSADDYANGVSADDLGNVFISGVTLAT